MASPVQLPRALLIYAVTVPLALLVGFLLTSPLDVSSFFLLNGLLFALVTPLLIRFHHAVLLFCWNAYIYLAFLPGRPYIWMLMVGVSLLFSLVNRILERPSGFVHVPAITWSLVFLGLVVILTARLRGGVSVGALSGEIGGAKGYFHVFFAILGYFALSVVPIPLRRAQLSIKLFYLSGLTALVPHLVVTLGSSLFFLLYLFPGDFAYTQVTSEESISGIVRLTGFSFASTSAIYFMLARYGLRGILEPRHPFRLLAFLACLAISALGGFRSVLGALGIILAVQFVLEGLHRTRLLPVLAGGSLLFLAILSPLASKLPLSVQRSLSFLPVDVDPIVRLDARNSTEWRLEMWRALLPDLHKYVWLGKGYNLSLADIYLARESVLRGFAKGHEALMLSGDYHNGPLSVFIPFGSIGVVAFISFLIVSSRALYRNYRYGHPALKQINTFLFAFFVGQTLIFIFIFGAFNTYFYTFTGTIGFGVALNGGAAAPQPALGPQDAQAALGAGGMGRSWMPT